jgi:hypothetical protein
MLQAGAVAALLILLQISFAASAASLLRAMPPRGRSKSPGAIPPRGRTTMSPDSRWRFRLCLDEYAHPTVYVKALRK